MTQVPTMWRFLQTPPAQGAWNMAVDEAILEFAAKGAVPPTLRVYSWNPACLSLGYAQPINDVDLTKLNDLGWDIVRRPTGGRAILHTDELTYSICGQYSEPHLAGSVLESYQHLSLALLEALHLMGINAEVSIHSSQLNSQDKDNPICFEVPSNYEITVDGKKLIGSAQARRKSGVLQHGSLPLSGDLTRIIKVLHYHNDARMKQAGSRLLAHATTVEEVLGYPGDWWIASQAFQKAVRSVLKVDLQSQALTAEEGNRAMELFTEKYNNPNWTKNK
jgi:lipoate-protein ligase A